MITEIIRVNSSDIDASVNDIKRAAKVISEGGLVVFPTETVYGLGGDGTSSQAAEKIYAAKGRPSDNPLIIHISSPEDAEKYAYTNALYYALAECYMPGPLTVILKARETVPYQTRGGLDTVAVRCPSNEIARRLIRWAGVPIAAPSANLSGSPSPTTAQHVIDDMYGRVDMIIDGGECDFGLESTIVKIDDDESLVLLRPGKITAEELESVAKVKIADAVTNKLRDGETAISPGMKYRHYAPKSPVILLDGDIATCVEHISKEKGKNTAIICYSENLDIVRNALPESIIYDIGRKTDEDAQAHHLFAILREADKHNYDKIYAPLPEKQGIGLALYNRLIRAAAHTIINLRR